MQLLINIKGHGYVPDADVAYLKAKVEALEAAAADVGLPLRADFSAGHPDETSAPAPSPAPGEAPPPEPEHDDTTRQEDAP